MKRTTYILIGILVLGLLVLLAFVFYASVAGNKPKEDKRTFPGIRVDGCDRAFTP